MTLKRFDVDKVDFYNVENPLFLGLKFYLISEGENRNDSSFTLQSLQEQIDINGLANKPILAAYSRHKDDFLAHESEMGYDANKNSDFNDYTQLLSEKPIGIIPETHFASIENFEGKNWLTANGLIWREYAYQQTKLLERKTNNKVSVEINVKKSNDNDPTNEIIDSFQFIGVTLLGDDVIEGVPGAHTDILGYEESNEFLKFKERMFSALNNKNKFIAKNELGSKSSLVLKKDKKSVSNKSWGSVNKAKLTKSCLMAANYKEVCKDVFMVLEDGWKDGKEGSCKYPVMELKGNTLVYNSGGLSSALGYAKKQGLHKVVNRITAIRKKLGLENPEERKNKLTMKINGIEEKYILFSTLNEKTAILYDKESGKFVAFCVKMENQLDDQPVEFSDGELKDMEMCVKMESEKDPDNDSDAEKDDDKDGDGKEEYDVTDTMCKYVKEAECKMSESEKECESLKVCNSALEDEKKEMSEKVVATKAECSAKNEEFSAKVKEFEDLKTIFDKNVKDFESLKTEYEKIKFEKVEFEAKAILDTEQFEDSVKAEFIERLSKKEFETINSFETSLAVYKYKLDKEKRSADVLKYGLDNKKPNQVTKDVDKISAATEAVNRAFGNK